MNNKIWLTIILAVLLALCTVFIAFKPHNPIKQDSIPAKVEVHRQAQEVLPEANTPEVKTKAHPIEVKKVYKKKSAKPKAVNKPALKQKEEQISKEPEKITEISITNTEEQPEGVIVPIQYTSKNTYKYVYTPNRF